MSKKVILGRIKEIKEVVIYTLHTIGLGLEMDDIKMRYVKVC